MKKIIPIILCCCLTLFAVAQNKSAPAITFDHSSYEFGTIDSHGGKVSHYFVFTNTGDSPLVVTKVVTSCSCTKMEFNKRPVAPGATDSIRVIYNPKDRDGFFATSIQIFTNAPLSRNMIAITGEVKGKK